MGSSPFPLLAFDTSAAHCAAAVLWGGSAPLSRSEPMARGQAERLIPFLEEVLAGAGLGWRELGALAVGVGPGNFTGVRISVAAARGLAMGLGLRAVGVSAFEAARDMADPGAYPAELVSLPAPRALAYVQRFAHGVPLDAARMIDSADPPLDLRAPDLRVRGHAAQQIARALGAVADETPPGDIALNTARIAAWRLGRGEVPGRPAPLYVRPADAAPPSERPPVLLP